jgi:hypothetical protein
LRGCGCSIAGPPMTEAFRQAAHGRIITSAHRINEGQVPEFAAKGGESDFFFAEREEPERITGRSKLRPGFQHHHAGGHVPGDASQPGEWRNRACRYPTA